jgi:hypothetical protein
VEGLRCDLGKGPARQCTGVRRAFLHDIGAPTASDLLPVAVGGGVNPEDSPRIQSEVVSANGRAVPIAGERQHRRIGAAVGTPRNHPDILDGATLENPVEMDLTLSPMTAAVGWVGEDVRFPVADELAVEVELVCMRRRRAVGGEYGSEARCTPKWHGCVSV